MSDLVSGNTDTKSFLCKDYWKQKSQQNCKIDSQAIKKEQLKETIDTKVRTAF